MRRHLTPLLLAATACGGRVELPPALFPMSQVWVAPVDGAIEGPMATDGRLLFVSTREGTLRGLDLVSGLTRWRVESRPGLLAARPGLLALRETDGTVWAMDPDTGSARWKKESGIAGSLPPVIDGTRIVVAGDGLAVLEAADGTSVWSIAGGPEVSATPVPTPSCLLVPEKAGTLRCRHPGNGSSLWSFESGGPVLAPPAVDERGRVLLGTTARRFVGLGLRDGDQRWRWKLGADVRTAPVVLGKRVVFASHEAVLYALDAGGGNLAWRATLPSRPLAPPMLLGKGVLVVCYGSRPSENLVLGFDGRTGARLGEMRTPAEVQGQPLLVGDRLVLPLRDLRVLALQLAAPTDPEATPPPAVSPAAQP